MADLATLNARKAEAEAALHKLLTGTMVVQLSHGANGDQSARTFTAANSDSLRMYIADLSNQIARLTGGARRGPIYFGGC